MFVIAVQQMQESMGERREVNTEHVLSAERRDEAQVVEPCAVRFVKGEMDPRLTVARPSSIVPLAAFPPLAESLRGKLDGLPEGTLAVVRLAVHRALAVGYLATAVDEARAGVRFHPERAAEEIWQFWMLNCRIILEEAGIPKAWAKMVRRMGSDLLVSDLKELKLAGFLGGGKLNRLGQMYAQAGVHLRMAQTDNTSDDAFRRDVRLRQTLPDSAGQLQD
jgi:hypothetical protein